MLRRKVLVLVAALALTATTGAAGLPPGPDGGPEPEALDPGAYVGQVYWVRPKYHPFNPDFFASPNLDGRFSVARAERFEILEVVRVGPELAPRPAFRVRFSSGREAWLEAPTFFEELFEPLGWNSTYTNIRVPPGQSPQRFVFERRAITSEEPAALEERLARLGPNFIRMPDGTVIGPRKPRAKPGGSMPK